MPGRHAKVRDEERDRHKIGRFTVAESVVKQTHFPLIVRSQATVEPQKHRACRAYLRSNEKPCHRSISMK
jgi:hypothetical protein